MPPAHRIRALVPPLPGRELERLRHRRSVELRRHGDLITSPHDNALLDLPH
jgi:hypothetical protein